ncbi:MAG: hypothetical protein Q9219_005384 [cf. Caloplaca sp. 3 TL-2023]
MIRGTLCSSMMYHLFLLHPLFPFLLSIFFFLSSGGGGGNCHPSSSPPPLLPSPHQEHEPSSSSSSSSPPPPPPPQDLNQTPPLLPPHHQTHYQKNQRKRDTISSLLTSFPSIPISSLLVSLPPDDPSKHHRFTLISFTSFAVPPSPPPSPEDPQPPPPSSSRPFNDISTNGNGNIFASFYGAMASLASSLGGQGVEVKGKFAFGAGRLWVNFYGMEGGATERRSPVTQRSPVGGGVTGEAGEVAQITWKDVEWLGVLMRGWAERGFWGRWQGVLGLPGGRGSVWVEVRVVGG